MKINFLGTGTSQGIPVIGSNHPVCLSPDKKDKRLRTSILIDWKGDQIIIPSVPSVKTNHVSDQFIFKNKTIIPVRAFHGELPILGYRFADFAYFTDVKTIEESELKKLKNLKVLVINALRIEEHKSHLNLEDAIALIQRINPKKAYLTHVSHKLGFHEEINRSLPNNIFLSYDGLEIEIN